MHQEQPVINETKETLVIGSIRLMETPYKVRVPVFEDITIERPTFVEKKVEIPVGFSEVINQLALELSKAVLDITMQGMKKQVDMLEKKVAELSNVKTEEKLVITEKPVEIEKPVYKDKLIEVDKVVYVNKEVINPVLKDTEVVNAIIIDKAVTNAVVTDVRVTNAIIKDVEVERAIIREKVIEVIHKTCLNEQGVQI